MAAVALDPYTLLGVTRASTDAEIRSAYRRAAFRVHPDKNLGDAKADANFQQLGKAMSLIGTAEARALFELNGDTQQWSAGKADEMFARVTAASIDEFAKTYRESQEETRDLLALYRKYRGDMCKVLEYMPLSRGKDLPRFERTIDEAVAAGAEEEYRLFSPSLVAAWKEHSKLEKDERKELKQQTSIVPRRTHAGFMADLARKLESKYNAPGQYVPADEEQFRAAQARLGTKKKPAATLRKQR